MDNYDLCPENLDELIKYLEDNTQYFKSRQVKLLIQLAKKNEQLKSTMSEIRKHTTGTRALDVALARVKELEAEVEKLSKYNCTIVDGGKFVPTINIGEDDILIDE